MRQRIADDDKADSIHEQNAYGKHNAIEDWRAFNLRAQCSRPDMVERPNKHALRCKAKHAQADKDEPIADRL